MRMHAIESRGSRCATMRGWLIVRAERAAARCDRWHCTSSAFATPTRQW